MKLLAAGALGSAAFMALPAGAASAPAAAGPAAATLTGDIVNTGPTYGGAIPGGTGTVSSTVCFLAICGSHETSQSANGDSYSGSGVSFGPGGGLSTVATLDGAPAPGAHGGLAASFGFEAFGVGVGFDGKGDFVSSLTGNIPNSSAALSLTFPGISWLGTALGYPNFATANGVQFSVSHNAETGELEFNALPITKEGLEADVSVGPYWGYGTHTYTPGPDSTMPTTTTDPLTQAFGGLSPDSPLSFAQQIYIPPQSAGFGDGSTVTPYQPSALTNGGTLQDLIQQSMMMSALPQGQANWPDAQSSAAGSAVSAAPAAPVTDGPTVLGLAQQTLQMPQGQAAATPAWPTGTLPDGVPPVTDPSVTAPVTTGDNNGAATGNVVGSVSGTDQSDMVAGNFTDGSVVA